MKNYVITIARGFGSGGKEIGTKLAAELGIPCYEKQILEMASEYSGINAQLFADADEKLRGSFIKKKLMTTTTDYVVEPSDKKFTSDQNLFNIQAQLIRDLAIDQSFVIIGKCADYVLRDYSNVVSVYIEAPRAYCVKSVMGKMPVSESEAHELIQRTDAYRADYYRYYTGGKNWTNPLNYDLTLNSEKVGRDRCVKVIRDYVKLRFGV